MANLTFSSATGPARHVVLPADRIGGRTLLTIAREQGVPVLFNCEVGDCAACLVEVTTLSGETTDIPPLTDKERFLLEVMGKLSEGGAAPGIVSHYRLACQYRVGAADILVTFI